MISFQFTSFVALVCKPRHTGAGKKEGPEAMPIKLQGHHNQVQFRNFLDPSRASALGLERGLRGLAERIEE